MGGEVRQIPGPRQGKYKMNLEYLFMPGSKELLKMMGTCQKDTEVSLMNSHWPNLRPFQYQNK